MRLSRRSLETELLDVLGTGRDAQIVARYYGLDGLGGGTLQSVGQEVGLTRERVRQIVTETSKRLSTGRPISRTLDKAMECVVDRMPGGAKEIEAELRFQGLTSGLFRLEAVMKAAELLGKCLPFSITEVNGERVVHARHIQSVDTIVRIARRVISRWGMATVSKVAAKVRDVQSGVCDRNLVVSALACLAGFHWLDKSTGWFWLSDSSKNRVLNRIRKTLSVANPIDISELRAGIARDYDMKGFSPPKRVLLELCRQMPGLRVNDNAVNATPEVNADDVLTPIERHIVHILAERGSTLRPSELMSFCRGIGVNRRNFYKCLRYSPIFRVRGPLRLIGSDEKRGRLNGVRESESGLFCNQPNQKHADQ